MGFLSIRVETVLLLLSSPSAAGLLLDIVAARVRATIMVGARSDIPDHLTRLLLVCPSLRADTGDQG